MDHYDYMKELQIKREREIAFLESQNGDNESEEDQENQVHKKLKLDGKQLEKKIYTRKDCPYLAQIKRNMLDFDFEKLCSVTLSNLNVYACLVCGKYFQGRGLNTHAYFHALEYNHHMFINLHNEKIYCLPDNYEVQDNSLQDIQYTLKPLYSEQDILQIDKNLHYSRALDGTDYLAGCVGLNNLKMTDFVNVIIQTLCRIPNLRDFFLIYPKPKKYISDVVDFQILLSKRLGELIRKIWNPKNFKGHVSPHELMQAISLKSGKKFKIGTQSDPIQLFAWLMDTVSKELKKIKIKNNLDIINECFQGEIQIKTYKAVKDGYDENFTFEQKNFLFLTLDIPQPSLYKEDSDKTSIPHIPIFELMKKYDGKSFQETIKYKRQFHIKKLPKYLVVHLKRFTKNNFFIEKNPTIVSFPLTNLNLFPYLEQQGNNQNPVKYNLLANICHEGKPDSGQYKIHVRHKPLNQWFEIQDLHIAPVMGQLVCLSEAYIQVYEKCEQS